MKGDHNPRGLACAVEEEIRITMLEKLKSAFTRYGRELEYRPDESATPPPYHYPGSLACIACSPTVIHEFKKLEKLKRRAGYGPALLITR
jgi:hypothetical protein